MSAGPDRDLRAAEYVLGTLPGPERAALDLERAVDPATEAMVRAWERCLAPLALAAPEVAPPPGAWAAILRALPRRAGISDDRVVALNRQVRRWRLATGAAALLAAGLALFVAVGPRGPAPAAPGDRYLAVVQGGGALPALVVTVDVAAGTAQVRPLAAETPAGRSLELWYVGGNAPPKPIGLVGTAPGRITLPPGTSADGVIAVSVEPQGGSPSGLPTGPVIYTGKLIRE